MSQDYEKTEDEDFEEESITNERRITISLSPPLIQKIKRYAKSKNLKHSQVVADALKGHLNHRETKIFKKLDRMENDINHIQQCIEKMEKKGSETNTRQEEDIELQKEQIETLFRDCTTFDDGFELEGDDGFYAQVEQRGLTGEVWTDELLKEALVYFNSAYRNYSIFTRPDIDDVLYNCSQAMGLSPDQYKKLVKYFNELEEPEETTEEK